MKNRWVVLIAGIVIQSMLGGIYAWSVYVPALVKTYGIGRGQSGVVFGISIAVFTLAMIAAGRLLSRKGPRLTALIGSVLFAVGYLLASVSGGRFTLLLSGIGVLSGAGIGFGYVCPLTAGMQWFPHHRGLISGLAVAGFGGGAVVFSSVATRLLNMGMDVLDVFRWIAFIPGGLLILSSLLLSMPDKIRQPKVGHKDLSDVCSAPFLLATFGIFAGTFAGLLIIGNLAPIAVEVGFDLQLATRSVALFAVGNAAGRIIWGYWFDRTGYKTIPLSLGSFGVTLLVFSLAGKGWLFLSAAVFVGFNFGANFVVYASSLSAFFGEEAFPRLYPVCFLGYGVAGIAGPAAGGWLAENTGGYGLALVISMAILFIATVITIFGLRAFSVNTVHSKIYSAKMR